MNLIQDIVQQIDAAPSTRGSGATYHKLHMTPAMAKQLLEQQQPQANRALSLGRVIWLERLIREGKWEEDVSAILLTRQGRILDGQHRLHAIIRAGVAVPVLCILNVPENVIKYIDTQKRRTTGQTLQILGQPVPTIHLATVNLLALLEQLAARYGEPDPPRVTAKVPVLDPDSVLQYLDKYQAEMITEAPILMEHRAACVYGPLVYAAKKYPEAAKVARVFMMEGQVADNAVLRRFHAGQKRLMKRALGGGPVRAETVLFVLDLCRALVRGSAPRTLVNLADEGKVHTALLHFFEESTSIS